MHCWVRCRDEYKTVKLHPSLQQMRDCKALKDCNPLHGDIRTQAKGREHSPESAPVIQAVTQPLPWWKAQRSHVIQAVISYIEHSPRPQRRACDLQHPVHDVWMDSGKREYQEASVRVQLREGCARFSGIKNKCTETFSADVCSGGN
jgi:hypothetical protein